MGSIPCTEFDMDVNMSKRMQCNCKIVWLFSNDGHWKELAFKQSCSYSNRLIVTVNNQFCVFIYGYLETAAFVHPIQPS